MMCCVRSRRSTSKEILSQVLRKIAITVGCAAVVFCAPLALAQRGGGGHEGGGSAGGRVSGGHSFSGEGGGHSYGGMRASSYSGSHDGIEVFSGSGSRGQYARGEYGRGEYSRGEDNSNYGAEPYGREPRGEAVRDGIVSYAGAPRHTTIGFPRTRGSWQVPESAYRSGAPLDFAGQGRSVWQASSRQDDGRRNLAAQSVSSRPAGRFQRPVRGNAEDRYGRDRGRRGFRGAYYPYAGYPFGGYGFYPWVYFGESGFGNWTCDQWTPDWDWQDGDCENNGPQIVAYGADGVYPAPESVTDARLEEYIRQHPWIGNGSTASETGEPASDPEFRSSQTGQSDSARTGPVSDTLLYLADGTNLDVTSYWLAGGELHYITSYGGENAVPIEQVDLQRTVNANAARGVPFTLRPGPRGGAGATR